LRIADCGYWVVPNVRYASIRTTEHTEKTGEDDIAALSQGAKPLAARQFLCVLCSEYRTDLTVEVTQFLD
jgi:hypothetical protein